MPGSINCRHYSRFQAHLECFETCLIEYQNAFKLSNGLPIKNRHLCIYMVKNSSIIVPIYIWRLDLGGTNNVPAWPVHHNSYYFYLR